MLKECPQCHGVFYRIKDHSYLCCNCGANFNRKQTNGDRIRSMTDEELVYNVPLHGECWDCVARKNCNKERIANEGCSYIILDWLKHEVE